MVRVSAFLYQISNGRTALAGTVLFLAFAALVLPAQSARSESYAGGAGSPDQSFLYSAEELYGMAEAYGPEGRTAYIKARFTFDLVFPLVYTFFLATAISWAFGRSGLSEGRMWGLNLFPPAGMAFDYLENITTSIVMGRYPLDSPSFAAAAGVFTSIKWFFVGGSFVVLAAGFIFSVARRR